MWLALTLSMQRGSTHQEWLNWLQAIRRLSHNVAAHGHNLLHHKQEVLELQKDLQNLASLTTVLQEKSNDLGCLIREMKSVIDTSNGLLYDKSHYGP